MRLVKHFKDGPHKILHIEAEGCKINVIVGTHDNSGTAFTSVEVHPAEPDDEGRNWMTIGPANVIVVPATEDETPESWVFRDIVENRTEQPQP